MQQQIIRVMDVGGSHVNSSIVRLAGGTAEVVERAGGDLLATGTREEVLAGLSAPGLALGRDGDDDSWGIAMPGPFDYELGTGTFEGVNKFGAIAGIDLRGELATRLGARPDRIRFLNDAEAYGIGEWAFGPAGRPDRFVCLTLGTGVGSAFLDRGTPVVHGGDVPPDGEAHRLVWRGAPLEDTVSTRAITGAYLRETGMVSDVRGIAQRARDGDSAAKGVLDSAMRVLGQVIAPWLERFEARTLVVGGSISRSWDLLENPVREGLAEVDRATAVSTSLSSSTLLDDAPLLGAAEWVSRR